MVIQSKKVPIGEIWFAESLLPELTMFIEIFKVSLGQIKSDLGEVRNNIWRSEVKLSVLSFFVF